MSLRGLSAFCEAVERGCDWLIMLGLLCISNERSWERSTDLSGGEHISSMRLRGEVVVHGRRCNDRLCIHMCAQSWTCLSRTLV